MKYLFMTYKNGFFFNYRTRSEERRKKTCCIEKTNWQFLRNKTQLQTNPAVFHRSKKSEPCIKTQDSTTKPRTPPPPPTRPSDTTQKKRVPDGRTCSPSPTEVPNLPWAEYKKESPSEGDEKKTAVFRRKRNKNSKNVSCFPESWKHPSHTGSSKGDAQAPHGSTSPRHFVLPFQTGVLLLLLGMTARRIGLFHLVAARHGRRRRRVHSTQSGVIFNERKRRTMKMRLEKIWLGKFWWNSNRFLINLHKFPSINQSINQWLKNSINRSINQSMAEEFHQSINQSMAGKFNQSINQWLKNSINWSINGWKISSIHWLQQSFLLKKNLMEFCSEVLSKSFLYNMYRQDLRAWSRPCFVRMLADKIPLVRLASSTSEDPKKTQPLIQREISQHKISIFLKLIDPSIQSAIKQSTDCLLNPLTNGTPGRLIDWLG